MMITLYIKWLTEVTTNFVPHPPEPRDTDYKA